VWYPAQGQPSPAETPNAPFADGPFPLIVFSHGQAGEPHMYAPDFDVWAQAGYVIAAPHHPLTIKGLPGGPQPGDIVNQPADLSFTIDRMADQFGDLVDVQHVAAIGHSSGAITALAVGLNSRWRDDRVDAVVLESVLNAPFENGTYFDDVPAVPVLFFHGDADGSFPIAAAHDLFEQARSPKYFLTIHGGDHSAPYRAGPPDYRLVADTTLAFLDAYLKDRGSPEDAVQATVDRYPFAGVESGSD
jgi:predicted dienelactone hydrolase